MKPSLFLTAACVFHMALVPAALAQSNSEPSIPPSSQPTAAGPTKRPLPPLDPEWKQRFNALPSGKKYEPEKIAQAAKPFQLDQPAVSRFCIGVLERWGTDYDQPFWLPILRMEGIFLSQPSEACLWQIANDKELSSRGKIACFRATPEMFEKYQEWFQRMAAMLQDTDMDPVAYPRYCYSAAGSAEEEYPYRLCDRAYFALSERFGNIPGARAIARSIGWETPFIFLSDTTPYSERDKHNRYLLKVVSDPRMRKIISTFPSALAELTRAKKTNAVTQAAARELSQITPPVMSREYLPQQPSIAANAPASQPATAAANEMKDSEWNRRLVQFYPALFGSDADRKAARTLALKQAREYAIPKDAKEMDWNPRPSSGMGKGSFLKVGNNIVARRQYFDDDKTLCEELRYQEGKIHGPARLWHRNGQLAEEIIFNQGQMDGLCRTWDQNGKLIASFNMTQGTGIRKACWPNGKIKLEFPYERGKRHGVCREWYKNGMLQESTSYHHDQRHGPHRQYSPQGVLLWESWYCRGQLHGVSYRWNQFGELLDENTEYYIHGRRATRQEYLDAMKKDPSLAEPRKTTPPIRYAPSETAPGQKSEPCIDFFDFSL